MKSWIGFCLAAVLITGVAHAQCGGMHSGPSDDMHQQMMKNMQADLDGMKASLQQMKALLAKTKEASAREQLQLNVNMWQSVIDNMDKHMKMMSSMGSGGHDMQAMGGGHEGHGGHEGMSCCAGMKEGAMKDGGAMSCGKGKDDGKDGGMSCCGGNQPNASEKPKQ